MRAVAVAAGLWASAAPGPPVDVRPAPLEAYFDNASHGPRGGATLRVRGRARRIELSLVRVGDVGMRGGFDRRLRGRIVERRQVVRRSGRPVFTLKVRLRGLRSGVYAARVRDRAGRVAYAPLVVRRRRGAHGRVLVVMPTNTWQAYNFRDRDGDGIGDTWYASRAIGSVDTTRPYLRPGLPRYFGTATVPFLRWLDRRDLAPDFVADDDLERLDAQTLRRRYRVIVFAGHEEYVTAGVFDSVAAYADGGGNVMFLSANNFFARVVRRADRLIRVARFRDLGTPESRWIGVQYVDWWQWRWPDAAYRVVGAHRAPWLFTGTGLRNGMRFGSYGKEADQRTASSPRNTILLAEARGIFGAGRSAEMTFRRTRAGGKIFAAGALDFVNHSLGPIESRLLDNLWAEMSSA